MLRITTRIASAPPMPSVRPMPDRIHMAGAPPDAIIMSQIPEATFTRAAPIMAAGTRRLPSSASTGPAAGPAAFNEGMMNRVAKTAVLPARSRRRWRWNRLVRSGGPGRSDGRPKGPPPALPARVLPLARAAPLGGFRVHPPGPRAGGAGDDRAAVHAVHGRPGSPEPRARDGGPVRETQPGRDGVPHADRRVEPAQRAQGESAATPEHAGDARAAAHALRADAPPPASEA